MLSIRGHGTRLCDRVSRREILRVGGLSALGLSLPQLISGRRALATESAPTANLRTGSAKSCIVLFLMGGPPQHSTWDPKPDAPVEIRGEFQPISTAVPGMNVSELMPLTAQLTDRVCV